MIDKSSNVDLVAKYLVKMCYFSRVAITPTKLLCHTIGHPAPEKLSLIFPSAAKNWILAMNYSSDDGKYLIFTT